MLIIAGHFTVDPDRRAEYLSAFADLVRRARQAPGCLDVAVTADALDAGRVYMYERWESWHDVTAWRKVANAPEIDIEVTDADVAMWDADGQRCRWKTSRPPGNSASAVRASTRCRRSPFPSTPMPAGPRVWH